MFHFEAVQNPIAENFEQKGGSGLVNILPLDKIPIDIPDSWTFKPTCMPVSYVGRTEEIANFKVREDDIWIVTYPKCGTTWTQEMTWLLMNDSNFDKAKSIDLTERSIYFELEAMMPTDLWTNFDLLNAQKSPRVIKTHLPIGLLPRDIWLKKCKIIYVTRDPKDAIVSFFHHFTGMTPYFGSMSEFAEQITTDNMIYCSYWNHVLEFWLIRNQPNVLFLTFEDMKKDLKTVIEQTANFVGKSFSQEQISQLADHLSFDNMKNLPTCNNQGMVKALHNLNQLSEYDEKTAFKFMRKGEVGGYKKDLPADIIERINTKTKNLFKPYGLHLYNSD